MRQYESGQGNAISASQIETWIACHRKWGFKSHLKLPTPEYDSALAGSRVHKILEDYLTKGVGKEIDRKEVFRKVFNVGAVATAMARDLPERGSVPAEWVESHFVIEPDGIKIQGYRDLISHGFVRDHKTTSALKWAKTEQKLGTDPQALIYANSMFAEDMADESVTCEWGYGQVKGPAKTKRVLRVFQENEAADLLHEHVLPHARDILAFKASGKEVHELDANTDHCDAYGGCPFKSQCKRPLQLNKQAGGKLVVMNREEMLAKLRARRAGVVASIMAKPEPGTATVSVGSETTTVEVKAEDTADQVAEKSEAIEIREGINPPLAIPAVSAADVSMDAIVASAVKAESDSLLGEEVKPEPKKRGRKPKAKDEIVTYDPKTTQVVDVESRTIEEIKPGFTLYIGCEPVKASVTYLHDIIPFVAKATETANGLAHWSLADFGAGKGLLAATMREYLSGTPLTGAVVVKFEHLPETQAVLGVLVQHAAEIVK